MPKNNIEERIKKEKEKLAMELAEQGIYLTGSERLKVAVACGFSDDKVSDYIKGKVAKLPDAVRMLAEMKKVIAEREKEAA